jgi:hypothetical protein
MSDGAILRASLVGQAKLERELAARAKQMNRAVEARATAPSASWTSEPEGELTVLSGGPGRRHRRSDIGRRAQIAKVVRSVALCM